MAQRVISPVPLLHALLADVGRGNTSPPFAFGNSMHWNQAASSLHCLRSSSTTARRSASTEMWPSCLVCHVSNNAAACSSPPWNETREGHAAMHAAPRRGHHVSPLFPLSDNNHSRDPCVQKGLARSVAADGEASPLLLSSCIECDRGSVCHMPVFAAPLSVEYSASEPPEHCPRTLSTRIRARGMLKT